MIVMPDATPDSLRKVQVLMQSLLGDFRAAINRDMGTPKKSYTRAPVFVHMYTHMFDIKL